MKYIIFLSLLVLSFSSQAILTCSRNGTRVIYTNGVTTKWEDAQDAVDEIEELDLDSQIDLTSNKVNYDLAYNYEESMAKDFLEAAVQRIPSIYLTKINTSDPYAAFSSFYYGAGLSLLSFPLYLATMKALSDDFTKLLNNYLVLQKYNPVYVQTASQIKLKYMAAFANGERVFAISHSQGGLFMNDVYNLLEENDNKRKYFAGFQMASPLSAEMDAKFGYATHDKDNLMNVLRLTAGVLPSNVIADQNIENAPITDPVDEQKIKDFVIEYFLNHGVLSTYLYDKNPELKQQVIDNLVETAQLLECNCPKAVINYEKNDLQINFDSTDSENPTLDGLTFFWDFGDGSSQETTTKNISHTYAAGGNFTVTLIVNDSYGNSDTAQADIQAGDTKPSVYLSMMYETKYDQNITAYLSGEALDIPLGMAVAYYWDFGDGHSVTTPSTTTSVTHPYTTAGHYQISLKVKDALSGAIIAESSIMIDVFAPIITVLDQPASTSIPIGGSFSYTFKCDIGQRTFNRPIILMLTFKGMANMTCTGMDGSSGSTSYSNTTIYYASSSSFTSTVTCTLNSRPDCLYSRPMQISPLSFYCSVIDTEEYNWYAASLYTSPVTINYQYGCQ